MNIQGGVEAPSHVSDDIAISADILTSTPAQISSFSAHQCEKRVAKDGSTTTSQTAEQADPVECTQPAQARGVRQFSFAQIQRNREGTPSMEASGGSHSISKTDTHSHVAYTSLGGTDHGSSDTTSTSTSKQAVDESSKVTKKKKKKKKRNSDTLDIMALMGGGLSNKKSKSAALVISSSEDDENTTSTKKPLYKKHKIHKQSPILESSLASKKRKVDIDLSSDDERDEDAVDMERKKAAERRQRKEQDRISSMKALTAASAVPSATYAPTQDKDIQRINLRSNILKHQLQSVEDNDDECEDDITLHLRDVNGIITEILTQRVDTFEGTYEVFNEYYAQQGQTQIVFWRLQHMEPVDRFLVPGAGGNIIYSSDTPHKLKLGSGPQYTIDWREHPIDVADALLRTKYLVDVPKKLPLSDAEAMSSIGITASDLQRAGEISGSMPAMQDNSMINIQIRDGRDSKTIILKFKKTDPMSKLHNYYCKKQGIAPSKVSFRFDGDKIKGSDTAEKLELEDDDLIDAIIS